MAPRAPIRPSASAQQTDVHKGRDGFIHTIDDVCTSAAIGAEARQRSKSCPGLGRRLIDRTSFDPYRMQQSPSDSTASQRASSFSCSDDDEASACSSGEDSDVNATWLTEIPDTPCFAVRTPWSTYRMPTSRSGTRSASPFRSPRTPWSNRVLPRLPQSSTSPALPESSENTTSDERKLKRKAPFCALRLPEWAVRKAMNEPCQEPEKEAKWASWYSPSHSESEESCSNSKRHGKARSRTSSQVSNEDASHSTSSAPPSPTYPHLDDAANWADMADLTPEMGGQRWPSCRPGSQNQTCQRDCSNADNQDFGETSTASPGSTPIYSQPPTPVIEAPNQTTCKHTRCGNKRSSGVQKNVKWADMVDADESPQ